MRTRSMIAFLSVATLLAWTPSLTQAQPTRGVNNNFAPKSSDASGSSDQLVTEKDDAYHYKYWEAGSPYDAVYTEWWYFNLYDQNRNLQAIFSYQVVDPGNVNNQGISFVSAAAYQGSNIVNTFDLFPLSSFSSSYRVADVAMGANKISVLDPNTYQINGASSNGRIAWNLRYNRESDSWFAGDHVHVAPAAWEQMSWLLYMPRAHVSGTVTVDGHPYSVESSGYHDHNWGEWDVSQVRWNWAQYSEPDLSFDLGDFIGNPNGRAAIEVSGRRTVFLADQYKLVHTKWAYDTQNKTFYPTESIFTADNGVVRAYVKMDVVKTDPLPVFPGQVIYEQPSRFTGSVTEQESGGSKYERKFEGNGFKEYTAITNQPRQQNAN